MVVHRTMIKSSVEGELMTIRHSVPEWIKTNCRNMLLLRLITGV